MATSDNILGSRNFYFFNDIYCIENIVQITCLDHTQDPIRKCTHSLKKMENRGKPHYPLIYI